MAVFILNDSIQFPSANEAEPDGLLAIGGDLSSERIIEAYKNGIFPWYEGKYILWWSPNPRCVLFPKKLKISKSMQQVLRKGTYNFQINTNFAAVINTCRNIKRRGQDSTWIDDDIEIAYNRLHRQGLAYSAEAWQNGQLAGGLYGIRMGKVFFGESMFSLQPNASKFAFISYVQLLIEEGVEIIDCQVHNSHLESLGAEMIPRNTFLQHLKNLIG